MGLRDITCPVCGRDQQGYKKGCPNPEHFPWPNEPEYEDAVEE